MRRLCVGIAAFAMLLSADDIFAGLRIDVPPGFVQGAEFRRNVENLIAELASSPDPILRTFHKAIINAPAEITIAPVTNDPRTWGNEDGGKGAPDRASAHTVCIDGRKMGHGVTSPLGAIVYIPSNYVVPTQPQWSSGVLLHELTHAHDIAHGRSSSNHQIRERRAVFIQNAWRDNHHSKPRGDYHRRFLTADYQNAKKAGALSRAAEYFFSHDDLPVF